MLLAGTILFAFYLVVAGVMFAYGIPIEAVALITIGFVGFQWKFGKWAALRSVGADDVEESTHPQLYRATEQLSRDMNMPMPRLMVAEMGVPNAFAIGRKKKGTVVVSTELMQTLDQQELEGVIAHELAHLRNRDAVMMVLGQSIASLVGIAVYYVMLFRGGSRNMGSFFLAYFGAMIAQMLVIVFVRAISRYREYVADADAARAIGSGEPLARALEKIQSSNERAIKQQQEQQQRQPQRGGGQPTPQLSNDNVAALMIFDAEHGLLKSAFSTHPPTEKRIERLRYGTF